MASSDHSLDTVYLQPHLLTKSALVHLLEEKFMNISNLNIMTKEQLVDLFERIVLPLPQRKYRQNRRGKLLTKLRNQKQLSKTEEKLSNISIGFGENSQTQSRNHTALGDRLKPPPDAVNYERKLIKLNNKNAGNRKNDDLDHIQIKKRKAEDKNGLVKETNKQEEVHTQHKSLSEDKANGSQKIVLKRSLSASQVSTDTSGPEKKKEKKLITWP